MSEKTLEFDSERQFHKLYFENPDNLKLIEKSLGLNLVARGNVLRMEGSTESLTQCEELFELLDSGMQQGLVSKNRTSTEFWIKFLEEEEMRFVLY